MSLNCLHPDKHITGEDFSGILKIDGNIKENCIRFQFVFDKPEMAHPLIISIILVPIMSFKNKLINNIFDEFECNLRDIGTTIIKSKVLYPKYLLNEYKIIVNKVQSKVSFDLCR